MTGFGGCNGSWVESWKAVGTVSGALKEARRARSSEIRPVVGRCRRWSSTRRECSESVWISGGTRFNCDARWPWSGGGSSGLIDGSQRLVDVVAISKTSYHAMRESLGGLNRWSDGWMPSMGGDGAGPRIRASLV